MGKINGVDISIITKLNGKNLVDITKVKGKSTELIPIGQEDLHRHALLLY